MNFGRPTPTTEEQALTSVVQYYMGMCPKRFHILAHLTEVFSGCRGIKILCNDALKSPFK